MDLTPFRIRELFFFFRELLHETNLMVTANLGGKREAAASTDKEKWQK